MKNKFLKFGFIVAVITILAVSLYTVASAATYSGSCGDNVKYTLDTSTGVLNITGTGDMKDYSYSSAPWYSYKSYVKTVKISDGVTSIGDSAFYYCSSLTSIEIPDSVTSIGYYAFEDCSSLTSIEIPDGMTSIGYSAFRYCSSLTNLYISDLESWLNVSLGDSSHPLCSVGGNLYIDGVLATDIVIPDSVTNIGDDAFRGCRSLTSIEIPDSVTSIGDYAFYGCSSLTSIVIGDSVTSIGNSAFRDCSSLTSIEIPDSVTSIGYDAFEDCSSLTSVEIPDSVTSIGSSAFYGCSSLTSVVIPDSVTSIGAEAFSNCSSLTSIEIPDSVTSIGYWAFSNTAYYNNTSNWENGKILYIGKHLIGAKTSISGSHSIKTGTLTIAGSSFDYCSSLTSIEIPDSVTSIGSSAFYGCSSLTSIEIPDSVTSIGDFAFEYCSSLTTINVEEDNPAYCDIDGVLFSKNKKTLVAYPGGGATVYSIPDSVTSIGDNAFCGCSSLTSIEIPDGVTKIDDYTFYNCSSLTSIEIPDSVTSIGDWAFYKCSKLKKIYLYRNSVADSYFSASYTKIYFCTVSFDLNGGSGIFNAQSKKADETIYLHSDIPTYDKEGYVFKGWQGSDGKTYAAGGACSANDDLVLTAIWGEKTYSVTYDANGGTNAPTAQTKYYFTDLTLSSTIPTKTGYNFMGWQGSDGKTYNAGEVYSENAALSLTAIWEIKVYTISYDANGGEGAPASQTKTHDIAMTLSEALPSKVGYNFIHWKTEGEVTKQLYVSGLESAHNYANNTSKTWTLSSPGAISISLTFDSRTSFESKYDFLYIYDQNGTEVGKYSGTTLAGETITVQGESVKLKLTSDGSNVYWGFAVTSATANGASTFAPGAVFELEGDTTLYAVWEEKTYSVTYDANGGTNAPTAQTKYYFTDLTLSSTIPTKTGYNFMGWQGSDGKTYNAGEVYSENAALTLTAIWEIKVYTISYDANGGDFAPESVIKEHFATVYISSIVPSKSGYDFAGWSGVDGKTYNPGDSYSIDTDLALTAVWREKSYTVSYNANGGTNTPYSQTKYYFTDLTLSARVPTKTGYNFTGWQGSDGKTYNAGEVYSENAALSLTAIWEIKVYTITYNTNGGEEVFETETKEHFASYFVRSLIPTKEGYNFEGWRGSDGKTYYGGYTYSTNANLVLSATWEERRYSIAYDANGGLNPPASQTKYYFSDLWIPYDIPVRDGYNFLCWRDAAGNTYSAGGRYSVNSSATLTAVWEMKSYKVTYIIIADVEIKVGVKNYWYDYIINPSIPTNKGHIFKGWATKADGDVVYYPGDIYSVNEDLTLYSIWEKINYADANGDSKINAKDAVLLAQYLAGWSVTYDVNAIDCNGDGYVNARDAVLLAQYLAGWDVSLG